MKTSLTLPEEVWEAAKHRATEERKNLQDIVKEALVDYLRKAPRKEQKK